MSTSLVKKQFELGTTYDALPAKTFLQLTVEIDFKALDGRIRSNNFAFGRADASPVLTTA